MNTLNAKDKLKALSGVGYTETQMADLTGIPQPTIHRIMNGQEPRESYVRIIDALYSRKRREIRQKKAA